MKAQLATLAAEALAIALLTLAGPQAFAAAGAPMKHEMTCVGNPDYGTSDTIQLTVTAVDKSVFDVNEMEEVPYTLLVTNGADVWFEGAVTATAEDVQFGFEGATEKHGEFYGMIYMDELEQSSFTLNDKSYTIDCGALEYED